MPDAPNSPPQAKTDLAGIKVLAVDNYDHCRELLAVILTTYGAQVKVLCMGGEVLIHLSDFKPDVLLSGILLPDTNGYALLKQIRALPPELGGSVPAIAVTGFTSAEDRRYALEQGFQAHVAKPFSAETLVTAIAESVRSCRIDGRPEQSPAPKEIEGVSDRPQ